MMKWFLGPSGLEKFLEFLNPVPLFPMGDGCKA
jgi:hypothetical protein